MDFKETILKGSFIVNLSKVEDERGFFARAFCNEEFKNEDLVTEIVQANISFNKLKGTLRGMHYQKAPYQETKFIRCIKGSIFDIITDLRKESPTYKEHFGIELTAENRSALFVPKDFAHGFITLEDNTEVIYMVSHSYVPDAEGGIHWDDPEFKLNWPIKPTNISPKDAQWSFFEE